MKPKASVGDWKEVKEVTWKGKSAHVVRCHALEQDPFRRWVDVEVAVVVVVGHGSVLLGRKNAILTGHADRLVEKVKVPLDTVDHQFQDGRVRFPSGFWCINQRLIIDSKESLKNPAGSFKKSLLEIPQKSFWSIDHWARGSLVDWKNPQESHAILQDRKGFWSVFGRWRNFNDGSLRQSSWIFAALQSDNGSILQVPARIPQRSLPDAGWFAYKILGRHLPLFWPLKIRIFQRP